MNRNDPGEHEPGSFAHRPADPARERALHRWDTALAGEFAFDLAPPAPGQKTWALSLPVKSSRQSMLIAELTLECDNAPASGCRSEFVVEWAGWNDLSFTISSLVPVGSPAALTDIRRARLRVVSTTFAGTVLEFGPVSWLADSPLVPVNRFEDMAVNFLTERTWDRADWSHTGRDLLPAGEQSFDVAWMYANLRYLQKPGRAHQTAYTRRMDVDLTPYQAVSLFTATDLRANFSLILEIDGVSVRAINHRRGLGGGDEMRALLSGSRLTALTFELEQAESEITEKIPVNVASSIRWVLLERKGTDPAAVSEVRGLAPVPPTPVAAPSDADLLPVGLLIDRDEFKKIRAATRVPGPLQKIAADILAEADSHLAYNPEQFVGRYLPVDLGNQGCERRVSPAYQMYHFNSCLIYSAVAYTLTGDLRYGQTARRTLFSTIACDTWQGGFPSRIPSGLPGYRAPFIEASTSEAVALCYDFIAPLLSAAERRAVEDALYEKGLPWLDMYLRLKGEGYLLSSNQGAVYINGLVFAALVARRSHPDVDAIPARNLRWFPRMLHNYFKTDGASNEGPAYWEYTMQNVVSALVAISRHTGTAVRDCAPPHLGETMRYMMHLRSLARERLAFLSIGDNNDKFGCHFMNSAFLFFAKYYGDRNALWLWHKFYRDQPNPPGALFFGKPSAASCSSSGLLTLLLYSPGEPAAPALEPARRFPTCDRIFLRTGCDHGDTLFFFEGGPQTFEHCHSDKGQFILEAHGERLAADPGVIRYQDPAHMFYKDTAYHNLITHRGRNQDYRDPKRAVVLDEVRLGEHCDYLDADLLNSYRHLRACRRRVLFVRPHYFVILDEAVADEPGLEWNFHSGVPLTHLDLASGLIRFTGEKAALTLAIASPTPLAAATSDYRAEAQILTHNLQLTPAPAKLGTQNSELGTSSSLVIASLLLPTRVNDPAAPQVTVTRESDTALFTVHGAWGHDEVRITFAEPPRLEVHRTAGGAAAELFASPAD
jgi:hypothetical protein